ncbi:MAG: class I SAM-dependent methyltransferase [Nannocystaceae bacterium]|nr:class I SAM-dependent methyltransferase [Nannocystaceae bacterium]
MEVRRALEQWVTTTGLVVTDAAWARLESLVELWARYGAAFNLVGDTSVTALNEHVREGLMAVRVAELAASRVGPWLDIGSGAGIPGLVVAIVRGNVAMMEPRSRRAAFLELAVGALKIPDSTVIRARVDGPMWRVLPGSTSADLEMSEITVLSAKAVMPVEKWLSTAFALAPEALAICHISPDVAETLGLYGPARLDFGDRSVVGVLAEQIAG